MEDTNRSLACFAFIAVAFAIFDDIFRKHDFHSNPEIPPSHDPYAFHRSLLQDPSEADKRALEWTFKLISSVEINNASESDELPASLDGDKTISSFAVGNLIESVTRSSLQYADDVEGWGEAVFIPAACYVPLCGDEYRTMSWVSNADGTKELDDTFSFDICCGIKDTAAAENEQEDTEGCQLNPLQSCRSQRTEAACSEIVDSISELDDDSQCLAALTTMELRLTFEEEINPDSCCVTCGCYGDPRCVSFEKETDIWVLCDGRGGDTDEFCQIQEEQCSLELDHEGRQCHWIDVANEDDWTIIVNGSRCVPNEASGESWIVMYAFDDYKFEIRQAERGIIEEVSITMDDVKFDLTAEDCFAGDFNRSWTAEELALSNRPGDPVSKFTFVDEITGTETTSFVLLMRQDGYVVPSSNFVQKLEPSSGQVVWLVYDVNTDVYSRIRCLTQTDNAGRVSRPRINVEAIVEPELDYLTNRENVDGFCATNDLEKTGTTSNTDAIEDGEGCRMNGVQDSVAIARELCGDSIMFSTIPSCIVSFCSESFFPNYATFADCVGAFGDGVTGYDFRIPFCTAMTYSTDDFNLCLDLWDNQDLLSGFVVAIETFRSENSNECAQTVDNLPAELGNCEPGVELQYLNDQFEWVTVLGIPERLPPCGVLSFPIDEFEEIFLNPIRLKQCSVDSTCLSDADVCTPQNGFSAEFQLVDPDPDLPPTAEPTSFPTTSPTSFPTDYPIASETEFPTKNPTPYPTEVNEVTESPTLPGDWTQPTFSPIIVPTRGPTPAPTDYPTRGPTPAPTDYPTRGPTKSPTLYPTNFPTRFPTSKPTWSPSRFPTPSPSVSPSETPTETPTQEPSISPTQEPTEEPTVSPTKFPTESPSLSPSEAPSKQPTKEPTKEPTVSPTQFPTQEPTWSPSKFPTQYPTTSEPTRRPTVSPTPFPTDEPTLNPTPFPTKEPTLFPTAFPTDEPTMEPTNYPTAFPTENPTKFPTANPTRSPTPRGTEAVTAEPTRIPTVPPKDWPDGKLGEKKERFLYGRKQTSQNILDDRGDISFQYVYSSRTVAEAEMRSVNVSQLLQNINEVLSQVVGSSGTELMVSSCEMTLVSPEESREVETSPVSSSFGVSDLLQSLMQSWESVLLIFGSSLVVIILTLVTIVAIRRGREEEEDLQQYTYEDELDEVFQISPYNDI